MLAHAAARAIPVLIVLAASTVPALWPAAADAEPVAVEVAPVALNPEDPAQATVGRLRWLGGLHLTSDDERFGGLSALGTDATGRRLLALTDEGHRVELTVAYDDAGRPVAIEAADIAPLFGTAGEPLRGKTNGDAEALAPGAGGEIIVAFEGLHRLFLYRPGETRPEPLPPPVGLESAPSRGGIEALTLTDDGRLLALTEAMGGMRERVGWVSDRGGWSALTWAILDDFVPTGAATLPSGDVVVVERFYSDLTGVVAGRIRRVAAAEIAPAAELTGELLAELRAPLTVDNMEGIAARPAPSGGAVITLISDDNFNRGQQRTLLMMFELVENAP